MELEVAYMEWLRGQGRSPAEGIDSFLAESEFVHAQMPMIHESEREQLLGEARRYLRRRSADPLFAGQFPDVYHCGHDDGHDLRYTITLSISDQGAEWVGRVWRDSEYLGEIAGAGHGPHVNYIDLARMHIESEIGRKKAIVRRVT